MVLPISLLFEHYPPRPSARYTCTRLSYNPRADTDDLTNQDHSPDLELINCKHYGRIQYVQSPTGFDSQNSLAVHIGDTMCGLTGFIMTTVWPRAG